MTDDLASGIRSVRDEDVQEPSQLSREELEMFRTQMKPMSLLAKVGVMPEFVFKFCFLHSFSCYQEQAKKSRELEIKQKLVDIKSAAIKRTVSWREA